MLSSVMKFKAHFIIGCTCKYKQIRVTSFPKKKKMDPPITLQMFKKTH